MGAPDGITLEFILDDNKLSQLFLEFVIKSQAQDNLEFWIEVELYKRITDGVILRKMGKRLYHTYLENGSDTEVNLEKKYKDAIKQKLEMDFWDTSLFDRAQQRMHHILSSDCVMMFSQKYLDSNGTAQVTLSKTMKARLTLVKHMAMYREIRRLERPNDNNCSNCLSWKALWPTQRTLVAGRV